MQNTEDLFEASLTDAATWMEKSEEFSLEQDDLKEQNSTQSPENLIAILRTLGATPGQIMLIFMVQGTVIGVIGTLIGAVVGILAALNVSAAIAGIEKLIGHKFLNADVYFIDYLPSQIQAQDVYMVCGAALVLSFFATLYPAWRAARTQPAEALRYE